MLRRISGAVAGAGLVIAIIWLASSDRGVRAQEMWVGATPVTLYQSTSPTADAPLVVISHGFAGSQLLMKPFAVTLARAGYAAVTFDYLGHGRNLKPLRGDITKVEGATQRLLDQTRVIVDEMMAKLGTSRRLAIIGHSMASDIVVRYAKTDSRVEATIAVSMFSPAVTADAPSNLLILVGGLESGLIQEAKRVLRLRTEEPQAHRTYGDFASGTARRLALAPYREHLGVLYEPSGLRETRAWLDEVFDRESSAPVDDRGGAILLLFACMGILGWPIFASLPRVSDPAPQPPSSWRSIAIAAAAPALVTPVVLMSFPPDFLSVLVGGYLAVHFGVYGVITWVTTRFVLRLPAPRPLLRAKHALWLTVAAMFATAYAAGAVALAMDWAFTSFAMMPPRWPLFAIMTAGTSAYFLADASLTTGAHAPRGAWLFTRGAFLASLGLAVALSFDELFFLLIIAILIVPYFLVYGMWSRWVFQATGHPAVGALASAVAFAWTIAVVFPMLAG